MGFKKFPLRRKKSRSKDDARSPPAAEAPSITQTAPPVLAEYDLQQQQRGRGRGQGRGQYADAETVGNSTITTKQTYASNSNNNNNNNNGVIPFRNQYEDYANESAPPQSLHPLGLDPTTTTSEQGFEQSMHHHNSNNNDAAFSGYNCGGTDHQLAAALVAQEDGNGNGNGNGGAFAEANATRHARDPPSETNHGGSGGGGMVSSNSGLIMYNEIM